MELKMDSNIIVAAFVAVGIVAVIIAWLWKQFKYEILGEITVLLVTVMAGLFLAWLLVR